jgi:hypothetical protein
MQTIKNVSYDQNIDKRTYQALINQLELEAPIIIKPNWGTSLFYTEAKIIDWTLETIQSEALIVESYGWSRTKDMLEKGKFGSRKRGDLRKSDQWFLRYSGIDAVLEKYNVDFLNITEENWAHRTVEPSIIREIVEKKHTPVNDPDFYSWVPLLLYDMRDCDLLSLSKLRLGLTDIPASLSIKNLFGMIPRPSRWRYHGKKNIILNQSIVDIYKVYDSLFNIKGVVEAVFSHTDVDIEHNKMRICENMGFAAVSKNPLHLDAVVMAYLDREPYTAHLKHFADTLGGWDSELVETAKHARTQ